MSGHISEVTCPKCEDTAYEDFNSSSLETFVHCSNCGFNHDHFMKRNDNGDIIFKDSTRPAETLFNPDNVTWETQEYYDAAVSNNKNPVP